MLQQLIHIIIISSICIVWGLPLFFILHKKNTEHYWISNGPDRLIFLFFAGLLSLSFFSSWVLLFSPLHFNILLYSTGVLIVLLYLLRLKKKTEYILRFKTHTSYSVSQKILFFSSILLLLLLASLKPVNEDTQLYHLQIIKWTTEEGAVPGLANLYPRLGLSSNWFNLISLFYIPFVKQENFTYLNCTLTIWFLLWLINKWNNFRYKENQLPYAKSLAFFYFLLIVYFLIDWQLFRDTANSTAYDFIVTVLYIKCLSFLIENILSNKSERYSGFFIIIALSIVTFKLSGIFVLLLLLLGLRNSKQFFIVFITGILILLPVFFKSYILTGYPLYPATLTFGHPDWQVPEPMVNRFREYIMNANRFYNAQLGFIDTFSKTNFNWIPFWIKGILIQHKLLTALSLTSLFLLFYKPKYIENAVVLKRFVIILWLIFFTWFFTAPDPRFGFGFLLFMALLPMSLLLGKFIQANYLNLASLLLSAGILFYGFRKSELSIRQPDFLIYPVSLESPPYYSLQINNFTINYPERINNNWNNRCINTPLPCVCEKNPYLQQRGENIKTGFKMSTIPDSTFIQRYNY